MSDRENGEPIDLGALGSTDTEKDRGVARIMRRAEPELARRAGGAISLVEWRRWRRPALSAAAILAAAAVATLVLVDVTPPADPGALVAEAVLPASAQALLDRPGPPMLDELPGFAEETS
jgi:hypothetical protein